MSSKVEVLSHDSDKYTSHDDKDAGDQEEGIHPISPQQTCPCHEISEGFEGFPDDRNHRKPLGLLSPLPYRAVDGEVEQGSGARSLRTDSAKCDVRGLDQQETFCQLVDRIISN